MFYLHRFKIPKKMQINLWTDLTFFTRDYGSVSLVMLEYYQVEFVSGTERRMIVHNAEI